YSVIGFSAAHILYGGGEQFYFNSFLLWKIFHRHYSQYIVFPFQAEFKYSIVAFEMPPGKGESFFCQKPEVFNLYRLNHSCHLYTSPGKRNLHLRIYEIFTLYVKNVMLTIECGVRCETGQKA